MKNSAQRRAEKLEQQRKALNRRRQVIQRTVRGSIGISLIAAAFVVPSVAEDADLVEIDASDFYVRPVDQQVYSSAYGTDFQLQVAEKDRPPEAPGRTLVVSVFGYFSVSAEDDPNLDWEVYLPAKANYIRWAQGDHVAERGVGDFAWEPVGEERTLVVPVARRLDEASDRYLVSVEVQFSMPLPVTSRRLNFPWWAESPWTRWSPDLADERWTEQWLGVEYEDTGKPLPEDENWWKDPEKWASGAPHIGALICAECDVLAVYNEESELSQPGEFQFDLSTDGRLNLHWETYWFPFAWLFYVALFLGTGLATEAFYRLFFPGRRED